MATLFEMKENIATLNAQIAADGEYLASKAADPSADMADIEAKKAHQENLKKRLKILEDQAAEMEAAQKAAVQTQAAKTEKDDVVAKKAAFYRAVLSGDQHAAQKAYAGLGAVPGNTADLGYGDKLLPTNTARELITEPVEENSLRKVEPLSNVTGLEEPRLIFEIEDEDIADVADAATAKEIEVRGENVVYGRFKTKVYVKISETVLRGTDADLVQAVEDGLRSALALKEKRRAFAPASGTGAYDNDHKHMSFYAETEGETLIKGVEGPNAIQAVKNAYGDLPDIFAARAVAMMRRQDYNTAFDALVAAGQNIWGRKPEEVLGFPVIWNDKAVIPVVGDFGYSKQNYEAGAIFDNDKDVLTGMHRFVLTAWGDHQIRLYSAFRLAIVNPLNASLSGLTIGSLTLTPEFDPDVTEYTATTTNASNKVTATAADPTATIEILNGETEVENGQSASWSVGDNTLTVKVSDGRGPTVEKTYTVTVTRGE